MSASEKLETRTIENALVQAFKPPVIAAPPVGFRGGLVLSSESDRLRHTRYHSPVDGFDEGASYETLRGQFGYLGPTCRHFGHLITELVHRILPSLAAGYSGRWLLVTTPFDPAKESAAAMPLFVRQVYDYFGLRTEDIDLVGRNVQVESLFVAEQGSDFGGGPKPGYMPLVEEFSRRRMDELHGSMERPRKLYVSRSFSVAGGFLGERYLEKELEREGFTIFRPEEHSFSVQMDHYLKSDVCVFPEGSAVHGTELLWQGAMSRVVLLNRREGFGLFKRILRVRAREALFFDDNKYVGSLAVHPRDPQQDLPYRGVSVLALGQLVESLRAADVARLSSVSFSGYQDAVLADAERYITEQIALDPTAEQRLASFRASLARTLCFDPN